MAVYVNNGIYRHIVFQQQKHAFLHRFELITTPGLLTIHGDMGTWCFSRVDDMFTFFRGNPGDINPSYWHEKLQAGRNDATEFDGEYFKECLMDNLDEEASQELLDAIEDIEWSDFEPDVRRQVDELEVDGFRFTDTWEIKGHKYNYQFIWCLYAIVWGIRQYDDWLDAKSQGYSCPGLGVFG